MDLLVNYDYYSREMDGEYSIPPEGFNMKSKEAETAIRSIVTEKEINSNLDVVKSAICFQIAFFHLNYGMNVAGFSGGELASESYSVGGESESKSYVAGGKGKAKMVGGVQIAPFAYLTLSNSGLLGSWRNVERW